MTAAARGQLSALGARATVPVLLGALLLAELPVMIELVSLWQDVPYFTHAFLVPLFSAWLVWDMRGQLARSPGGERTALGFMAAGAAVLGAGVAVESLTLRALSLPLVACAGAAAALGPARLRAVTFPLGYLVLMTPLPPAAIDAMSLPLQDLAAAVTGTTLAALAIPAFRDGLFIHLDAGRIVVHVSEACNGLRFLFAMLAVSVAFAGLTLRTLRQRALVVLLGITIAILANVARVAGTAIIAHAFGADAASGFSHVAYGKLVYGLMLLPFAAGVLLLRRAERAPRSA